MPPQPPRTLWDERQQQPPDAPVTPGSPQQVAVALDYQAGRDNAPRVVANGRGALAEQILQLAFANGVKVRTDPDLAQLLATVDVDSIIPLEAFAAVAEILSYVYRLNSFHQNQPSPDPVP